MIRAAIIGPMSIIGVGDREKLYTFFKELNVFFEKNKLKKNELIFDRLYKKYVNFSDVDALHLILKGIEEKFIGSSSRAKRELYQSYFSAFYRIIDQVNFLKEKNALHGRFQIGVRDLPYNAYDQMKSDEFYDSLTETDEPFWMRDITSC